MVEVAFFKLRNLFLDHGEFSYVYPAFAVWLFLVRIILHRSHMTITLMGI